MQAPAPTDTTSPLPAIEARRVTKIFGEGDDAFQALDAVSLSIRENEFFTLLGPSGCGKTTLLRLIAGFEQPSAGHILLEGKNISNLPPYKRPVNTVFQSYALFPHLTVAQNIAFGLQRLGKPKAEVADTVERMLRLVKMEHLKDRRTSNISGGQQQRVALARALAPRPRVLLLDEPLSALDLKLRKEMQIELKRLQGETGITFIFVTHDQEEALTMSDRIAVMSEGKVLQVGGPREIYDRPADRFVASFIGDTNFLPAQVISTAGPRARLAVCGVEISAALPEGVEGPALTMALRPEQLRLEAAGAAGALQGVLKDTVYFGTDTHFHITLTDGTPLIARVQNARTAEHAFRVGEPIGARPQADALQALHD
ncbi:ABC transporter ATP-binding protein [Oceanicella sp. SM1341]|uniref:ABC transporter ATP-binding protein n=1 Tax=Oceanicella sp. SM1341 TaxID=1548889 RepID=UPI000E49E2F6|nr:ABC transporter ATP-binding protein [Oceanicella sp. SM1341]